MQNGVKPNSDRHVVYNRFEVILCVMKIFC